jgi:hypothetical protein
MILTYTIKMDGNIIASKVPLPRTTTIYLGSVLLLSSWEVQEGRSTGRNLRIEKTESSRNSSPFQKQEGGRRTK